MSSTTLQHVPISAVMPRPAALMMWERTRQRQVHWVVELIAEAVCYTLFAYLDIVLTRMHRPEHSFIRSRGQAPPPRTS